jgi:hypothetical protein
MFNVSPIQTPFDAAACHYASQRRRFSAFAASSRRILPPVVALFSPNDDYAVMPEHAQKSKVSLVLL